MHKEIAEKVIAISTFSNNFVINSSIEFSYNRKGGLFPLSFALFEFKQLRFEAEDLNKFSHNLNRFEDAGRHSMANHLGILLAKVFEKDVIWHS